MTRRKYIKKVSFFLICIFACLSICAQTQDNKLRFKQISIKQGLICPTINCIMQDSRGFIWLGTNDGLARWDGLNFQVLKNNYSNGQFESDNSITSIAEDKAGNIWLGTVFGGILKYDRNSETLSSFPIDTALFSSQTAPRIQHIFIDKNQVIWVSTLWGLFTIENNKTYVEFGRNSKGTLAEFYAVSYVGESPNGEIWVGTSKGIIKYNRKTKAYKIVQSNLIAKENGVNFVRKIYWDKQGKMYIASYGYGVFTFDEKAETFTPLWKENGEIPRLFVSDIIEDSQNRMWISCYGRGLYLLDKSNYERLVYKNLNSSENDGNLGSERINALFQDRSGVIFLGTQDNGLFLYSEQYNRFPLYRSDNTNFLPDHRINSFTEDSEGNWWLGSDYKGIIVYNPKTGFTKNYPEGTARNCLPKGHVNGVHEDEFGNFWVATYGAGVFYLNKKTQTFTKLITPQINNAEAKNIFSICYDKRTHLLWINTNGYGEIIYNTVEKNFECLYLPKTQNVDNQVWYAFPENDSITWLCFNNYGVSKYNRLTQKTVNFRYNPRVVNSLASNCVFMVLPDPTNTNYLWFATRHGLDRFDKRKKQFENFNKTFACPDFNIAGIQFDNENNLWLSSTKGISKIDFKKNNISNFDDAQGLQSHHFVNQSCGKTKDGLLFFGGNNGFNAFYPQKINAIKFVPKILFTDLFISNQKVSPQKNTFLPININELKELNLSYKQNIISLEFAATDYNEPNKTIYYYRLCGFDDKWTELKDRKPFVTYTNLPSGEYVFEVKATNADRILIDNTRKLKIAISPPFWNTYYFYILIIFCIILCVYFFIQIRLNHIQQEKTRLEEQVHLRTQELQKQTIELERTNSELSTSNATKDKLFSIIAHDLRGPIGNMSSMLELLLVGKQKTAEDMRKFINMMYQNSRTTLNLLENLLSWAQEQRGQIVYKPNFYNIYEIMEEVSDIFEVASKMKGILVLNEINENTIIYFDSGTIHTVLRNLLSNAIKFTESGGKVVISAHRLTYHTEICIEDSGVGISAESLKKLLSEETHFTTIGTGKEKGNGLGLMLCKDLIEKNHGKLRIESEIGKGSRFIFTLPNGPV